VLFSLLNFLQSIQLQREVLQKHLKNVNIYVYFALFESKKGINNYQNRSLAQIQTIPNSISNAGKHVLSHPGEHVKIHMEEMI